MDKQEAKSLAQSELSKYRAMPYEQLTDIVDSGPITKEIKASSGVTYHLEVQAFWDDKTKEDVRVICSIDDMGIRTFFPLSEDFIMAPDGNFVDE